MRETGKCDHEHDTLTIPSRDAVFRRQRRIAARLRRKARAASCRRRSQRSIARVVASLRDEGSTRRIARGVDGSADGCRRHSAGSPERVERRQRCRISAAVRRWRRAAAFFCASSGLLHAARVLRCGPACSVLRRRRHPTSRCGNSHAQSLIEGARVGARTFLAELDPVESFTLRSPSGASPLD